MMPKRMLKPVVAAQLHSADMFLRPDVISAVTISSVSKYVTLWSSDLTGEQVLEVIGLLLFAPGAHLRKKARKPDLGRKFMELRVKIIKNMVFNCQVGVRKDYIRLLQPFLRLQDEQGAGSESLESKARDGGTLNGAASSLEAARVQRVPFRPPAWTVKGFIGREDVDTAVGEIIKQEVDEAVTSSDGIDVIADGGVVQTQAFKKKKTAVTQKISLREEIPEEIVKHMWKRWTDWFGNSRNEARKSFTLDLGVAFLEPKSRWKPICSCSSADDYFDYIYMLPSAEISTVFRSTYEATSSNVRLFHEMVEKYPGFVVTCQHTVEVYDGVEEMAQNQGAGEITLRRSVNLLQVAANFLTAYFQVSNLEVLLGGSENSFKLIFIVALCFSEVVSRASRPRVGNSSRELVCSESKDLGLLIPGDIGRLNFIMEKCLRMTRATYEALNSEGGSTEEAIDGEDSGGEIGSQDDDVDNTFA